MKIDMCMYTYTQMKMCVGEQRDGGGDEIDIAAEAEVEMQTEIGQKNPVSNNLHQARIIRPLAIK